VDVVGTAGGVPGRTVVIAAVVVVDVVAISAAVGCCSWRRVVMLMRYRSDDRDLGGLAWVEASSSDGVGGLLIFS
jgi:hypothetical protein